MKSASARHGWAALVLATALFLLVAWAVGRRAPLWLVATCVELAFLAAAVGVTLAARLRPGDALALRSCGLREVVLAAVGVLALHFVLRGVNPAVEPLLRWLDLDYADKMERFVREVEAETRRAPVAVAIAVGVLPAICEESLFRGILLAGFGRTFGRGTALVISAVVFGLIHELPSRILYTFILGTWFGLLVLRTGSLWTAVLAHAINNLLALFVPESRFDLPAAAAALPVFALVAVVLLRRQGRDSPSGRLGE